MYLNGKTKSKARVCFKKKTPEAIEQTQKRLKDRARKSQKKVTEEAKAFNEYIVLITSLPDEIADNDIMELYRFRWQIELFFKRLKSIMDYGELPQKTPDSIFSWLNGKLMIALLVEKMMSKGSFSPQEEFPPECLERDEEDLFAFEIEPVQGG